jgi:hypothetical protein
MSSLLEIATVPSREVLYSNNGADMQQPYGRIVHIGTLASGVQLRYTGVETPATEHITLPEHMHSRLTNFALDHLICYEPRIDRAPIGNKQYLCHSFAQELATGIHIPAWRACSAAIELEMTAKYLPNPEQTLEPGDLGLLIDLDEGYPLHSFVSLGGEGCMQVMDTNSHIGKTTTGQLLDYYARETHSQVGIQLIDPADLEQLVGATRQ